MEITKKDIAYLLREFNKGYLYHFFHLYSQKVTDTLYSRTTAHINKDFHKRGNSYFFAKNPTFWIYGMRPLILRKSLYKQKN